MSGVVPANPVWHFSIDGEPATGYKLYTYLNGTTTPSTTWQDPEQETENTNPIILASDGNATIFVAADTVYTFRLDDPDDAPVQTIDDIAGAVFAGGTIDGDVTVDGFLRVNGGTAAEPGLRVGDAETGLYGDASNLRVSVGGVLVGTFSASGLALPGALTATGAVTAASVTAAGAGTFGSVVAGAITGTDVSVTGVLNMDGSPGTTGTVLTSAGAGVTPTWSALPGASSPDYGAGNAALTHGAIGTYAFASVTNLAAEYAFGDTVVSTGPTTLTTNNANGNAANGTALTGTWRCMGAVDGNTSSADMVTTLWLRVA
jgi:hypothetical protein